MAAPALSEHLPAAHALSERFGAALVQVQDKLLHLVANSPLLLVAILLVMLAFWIGGFVSRHMHVLNRLSQQNPYMDGLLRSAVRIIIGLSGVLVALDLLNATSLVGAVLGSAGVVGLVLGFAFKDIAENYMAGVLLSLRQPFAPGDAVRVDTYEGKVVSLTSRATILMTGDGNHLQLPNSLVFKSVVLNFTRNPKRKFSFEIAVGSRAVLHEAMDEGIGALRALAAVLADPAPAAQIRGLDNQQVLLVFEGWIDQRDSDLGKTRSEAIRHVRSALWKAGIPPPEPLQRVVLSRGQEATNAPVEGVRNRDTSVDTTIDQQLHNAQRQESGANLLEPASAPAAGSTPAAPARRADQSP